LDRQNAGSSCLLLFLRAAVAYGDDSEAWLNVLAQAVNDDALWLLPAVVEAALQHCGYGIATEVRVRVTGDSEATDLLMRILDSASQESEEPN